MTVFGRSYSLKNKTIVQIIKIAHLKVSVAVNKKSELFKWRSDINSVLEYCESTAGEKSQFPDSQFPGRKKEAWVAAMTIENE